MGSSNTTHYIRRFVISIDEKSELAYFPKEIRREGFVGEVEGLPNDGAVTLIRSGTRLPDVARSLELVSAENRHRIGIVIVEVREES